MEPPAELGRDGAGAGGADIVVVCVWPGLEGAAEKDLREAMVARPIGITGHSSKSSDPDEVGCAPGRGNLG